MCIAQRFADRVLYHVRAADANHWVSRYVAPGAPDSQSILAACIAAADKSARITQLQVRVPTFEDGLSTKHRHGIAVEDLFLRPRTTVVFR